MARQSKEVRNKLKPYRCVGGFILFSVILNAILPSLAAILAATLSSSLSLTLINEICTFVLYSFLIYSYYLGYRVFFKQFQPKLVDKWQLRKEKVVPCLISCLFAFLMIRFCWDAWYVILKQFGLQFGYSETIELTIVEIIYTCLVAPIVEEIVFRGWIYNALSKYGRIVAILITSFSFGMYHGNLLQTIPCIVIGLILNLVVYEFDSLLPAIVLHMATNTFSIVQEFNHDLQFPFILLLVVSIIITIAYFAFRYRRLQWKQFTRTFKLLKYSISYILAMLYFIVSIVIQFIYY